MSISAIQAVILSTLSQFGASVLAILGAVISIGLAYLIFRFGWRSVQTSLSGGSGFASGEYMASLPGMNDADRAYYRSKKYPGNH